ncbi:MAG: hypothetical protein AAFV97_04460, partial [Bacteroidota bacterium]
MHTRNSVAKLFSLLFILHACTHNGVTLSMEAERHASRATSEATPPEVDTATIAMQATAPESSLHNFGEGLASKRRKLESPGDMKATSSAGDFKRGAATSQQDTKRTASTSLSAATQYGFRIGPIDKDGNCLFRAIAEQLQRSPWNIRFPESDDYYNSLRKIAVEHVRAHPKDYS